MNPRWSTPTLLATCALAALGGYGAARRGAALTQPTVQTPPSPPAAVAPVAPPAPVSAPAEAEETRWRDLRARPACQDNDEQLIAALETLAARDPARALALVQAETKQRLRWEEFRALLRGWARRDADAAGAWAMQQTYLDKTIAVDAVLAGLVDDPARAVALTRKFSAESPSDANFFGNALLSLLAKHGQFDVAAAFAHAAPAEVRADWLGMTYELWAAQQPAGALAAVGRVTEPEQRAPLLHAAIEGWAQADPRALADYAATSLTDESRTQAYTAALRAWAALDVVAAAEWIGKRDPAPELDAAVAALATTPQLLRHPEMALQWAKAVSDPGRRATIQSDVFHEWAQLNPAAARRGVEQSMDVPPEEKTRLLASLPRA